MSDILGIGTSGLVAAQKSLDTISHNIANASSPGYSRQVSVLSARESVQMGSSFAGSGVEVQGTRRIVDQFLIHSLHAQQSVFSEFDAFSEVINQLDNVFSDPATGITGVLNSFFNAFQDLNMNPDSSSARQLFLSQAQVLENRFSDLSQQISSQFNNISTQIGGAVNRINSISDQIAQINVKIINTGTNTFAEEPNDLLDLREQLVLSLSEYVSTSTIVQDNGAMNIFVGNGQALVINGSYNRLSMIPNLTDATKTDVAIVSGSSTEVITNNLKGGQMGGLLSLQNDVLTSSQNALGRIALTLASTFNDQHKKGIDLEGNLGGDLFNDPNSLSTTLERSLKSRTNLGNAVFSVTIDPITISSGPTEVYSQASSIMSSGSLTPLSIGMLSVNNTTIRATLPTDDTVSTSDNQASAIAIANAINASSLSHHVSATAEQNVLYLGLFTTGALNAGQFAINGINIISTGANEATLLQDINAVALQTGVSASGDSNGHITLVATDGRNIQLTTDGTAAAANFAYFDTHSGIALDKVTRASVKLYTQESSIKMGGANPAGVGFPSGTTPLRSSSLTTDNYELNFDGTFYTLRNLTYNTVVAQSNIPYFQVDGMTIQLASGNAIANDSFVIQPTRSGAHDFSLAIINPNRIALGCPVRVDGNLHNRGQGQILLSDVTNTSGIPAPTANVLGNAFKTPGVLSPPLRIEFISANAYRVYDVSSGLPGTQIGPDQPYNPEDTAHAVFPINGVVNQQLPGPNPTYTYDPGYRIIIQGNPQTGDVFTIEYNNDATGDNRNGLKLANLQLQKTMANQSSTFQDSYAQLVGDIGTKASQAKVSAISSENLLHFIESRRNAISGVNLDEEAANLLRFEQAYHASAQVIVIARSIFETLMGLLGR
jgi:flagellar hook-associated protein 1 FlgK